LKIIIAYDNKGRAEFKTGWGFSCIVEAQKKILFDTGCNGVELLFNLKKLGYTPKDFDILFLSHQHWDHIGGLFEILEENKNLKVFVLESFSPHLKDEIRKKAELIEVREERKIFENVYTTGLIENNPDEQSLIVKTEKGLVIITCCSHPGIVNIIKKAKEMLKENVYLVVGGFHLFDSSNTEIEKIVRSFRDLEVEKVAPCHCIGEKAISVFEKEYKEDFIEAEVGKVIEV
jgi:7,8-dihydropterin-6-yl-methyl-4-(beta-D-ribofuranosyl)aminobenzene 5'-phosphate synthase